MFNIKWGVIAGGLAFFISLILGGFSGAAFGYVLLRAVLFLVIFFGLGVGCNMVIVNFLPELLIPESSDRNEPFRSGIESPLGSRINITVGGNAALPEQGGSSEVGNIAELMSGAFNRASTPRGQGMDQSPQDGYTDGGGVALADFSQDNMGFRSASGNGAANDGASKSAAVFEPAPAYSGPVFTASVGEGADLGALPDLDAMAGAFLTNAEEEESPAIVEMADMEPSLPAKSGGGKAQGFEGDFNPKELAAGIRTVLNKEKQG